MIVFDDVTKFYLGEADQKHVVLDRIRLKAAPGRVMAVLGSNGIGKTTLLRLAAGLIEPDAGSVLRDQRAASPLGVGFVDQHYRRALFPWMTVLGNLKLACHSPERAGCAMELLGVQELAGRMVYQLSGGQAQLVSIARAITMPGPIIADELTSALDFERGLAVLMSVRAEVVARQRVALMTMHDIDLAIVAADDVFVLPRSPQALPLLIGLDLPTRSRDVFSTPAFQTVRRRILEAMFT